MLRKTIYFRQMATLLEKAGALLASKTQLSPQSIQKIHQELFDTLQDVPEGTILKRAAKISVKGKKGKKSGGGPPNKKSKRNEAPPVSLSQDGVPNNSQTSVRDEVEILDVVSPHQEGEITELGHNRGHDAQQTESMVSHNVPWAGSWSSRQR